MEEILQRRNDRVLVRSGDVVRHPLHPWSAATRMLLRHLEAVGFSYSPRVVGHDGESDLLTFIPGASGADGWACVVDEEGLAACARLLRAYHQAVAGWRPDIDLEWFDGSVGTGGPGQLVCHGDFGPWNSHAYATSSSGSPGRAYSIFLTSFDARVGWRPPVVPRRPPAVVDRELVACRPQRR